MQGKLSDMTVMDLIQHNCMEQKTARVKIKHKNQTAEIFFRDGNMTHAISGNLTGEEAVYQIITWEDGEFFLENGGISTQISITQNWSGVLLEGVRRLDEQSRENTDELFVDNPIDNNLIYETGTKNMAQRIETILKEMGNEITGHITSTVVGMDALNIAEYSSEKQDMEMVSAQMTLLFKLVETSVSKINNALILEDSLLTTKNAYLLMRSLPDKQHFLGIVVDRKTAILGNLRLMSKIYADRISKAMPK